jgi:redox-sensitive bicupin YhaK (pirin superfamily)
MFQHIANTDRGFTNLGWLKSYHTFSFGNYYNPQRTAFRSLRVLNEDFVAPGKGFDLHAHSNMEILTYVLSGALSHQDSMGNKRVIRAGEFQYMSAGSGISHSEYNASSDEHVHFIQIWITPNQRNLSPAYAELPLEKFNQVLGFNLIVSEEEQANSLRIHQDASVFVGNLSEGQAINYQMKAERGIWIYQIAGSLKAHTAILEPGDSLCMADEKAIDIVAKTEASFLLFDLA